MEAGRPMPIVATMYLVAGRGEVRAWWYAGVVVVSGPTKPQSFFFAGSHICDRTYLRKRRKKEV